MPREWVIKSRQNVEPLIPDYERDLPDPFLMKDMERVVRRILRAIENNERVMIFADYDADGVPGAAILALFFEKIGFHNYEVYFPDRHHEDHGLGERGVRQAQASDVALIITVDCGIASAAEINLANELGLEVIVTDHHLIPEAGLPPAFAVLNPQRADCAYPYKMLCGAGVIFKLVQALIETARKVSDGLVPIGWEKWLLDLVAIATVSDMAPLTGENRALVYFGLKVLRKSPRVGLQQMFRELRLVQESLNEDDIAFSIGPRLNSASRMAHASEAFVLLTTNDVVEAGILAKKLEQNNKARRGEVDKILLHLAAYLGTSSPSTPLIVVGHESWSLGVLGLAASRLVEKFNRSVFIWGKNGNGLIKGSCRSDGTVHVLELMQKAGGLDFFANIGGHAQAGGFSLVAERLAELEPRLLDAFAQAEKMAVITELFLAAEISLAEITPTFYTELEKLGPFGIENPKPVFLFRNVVVGAAKKFGGAQNHLELLLQNDHGQKIKAISFFNLFPEFNFSSGQKIDLAATLEKSYFRSTGELRLRIVDLRVTA